MPFCNGIDQALITPVLFQALLDFGMRGPSALKIAFVDHHGIGKIEHHDFLQLQPASVIGVHHQDGRVDNAILLERHRFLTGANGFNDHVIKPRSPNNAPSPISLGSCDKMAILPFGF